MNRHFASFILYCILSVVLSLMGWQAGLAQRSPTTPPTAGYPQLSDISTNVRKSPAPPLPYSPANYLDVLAGKAPLRILLLSSQPMLAWKGDDEVRIINLADESVLYTAAKGEQIGVWRDSLDHCAYIRKNNANYCPLSAPCRLESTAPLQIWSPAGHGFVSYPSPVIITPVADFGFSVTRDMLLEEYLRNVVPAEMPHTFHPQALRAQAIIARTYALTHLGGHIADGADLTTTISDQAYVPDSKRTVTTDAAVRETKGLVLMYGDQLIEAYYHADCAGSTEDAGCVWGPEYARPYLVAVPDSLNTQLPLSPESKELLARVDRYGGASPSAHWTKVFTADMLDRLVRKNIGKVTADPSVKISHVTNIAVESRTPSGRAQTLRVEGDGYSVLVNGDKIRWLFGSGAAGSEGLWSTLFELTVNKVDNGNITSISFTGSGRGHGVGLCQWGTNARAKAGQTFRDILNAYYPGTHLSDK